MPMPPSRSGVSNSSSRMHSSIYGSAMAPKPAAASGASRPGSAGGNFKVGGSKAFQAPTSNRTAAEDRIRALGRGPQFVVAPSDSAMSPAPVLQQPAGARRCSDENNHSGNLLADGSGGVPMSPSVFSNRSKMASMAPSYRQQPPAQQSLQQQQQLQQQQSGLSGEFVVGASVDYTVTDISDHAGGAPPPAPPPPAPVEQGMPKAQPFAPLNIADYGSHRLDERLAAAPAPVAPAPVAPAPLAPAPIDPKDAALGKGVFANVRLTHRADGQVVAVKTYDHKEAREERAVAKHMLNEEKLAGKLQHENIIAPQVVHRAVGKTELEMEYAPGGTLEEHIKKRCGNKPMPEAETRRMFRQVVDAVVYLHEKGICHRDIKCENVVLDADGNCKLVDFGAAKEGGADTFLMSMQGTPAYMAPEVAQQRAHKGGPADVWALGVLLYNLVSGGAFPFWGKNMDELRRNISQQQLKIPPHISPPCKDLLTRLLQKTSANRMTIHDVRKHAFLKLQPGEAAPSDALGMGGGALGAVDEMAAWAEAAAHMPQSPARQAVNAAVSAQAASAANAYRGEIAAARASAAQRLQQQQQQQQDLTQTEKKHMGSPARNVPQYQYASRNPITGGPAAGVGAAARPGSAGPGGRPSSPGYVVGASSRPGTANSTSSQSRLAGLMNGSGTPGTPVSHARGVAQQMQHRPRPF